MFYFAELVNFCTQIVVGWAGPTREYGYGTGELIAYYIMAHVQE